MKMIVASLNYVVTIVFSFSCIETEKLFLQKKFHISYVYYLLSQRFLYLMNAQLPKVRNNLLEEMNPEWDCIVSKTRAFKKFSWEQKKKSKEIFLL